jgi:uncharacterized protein
MKKILSILAILLSLVWVFFLLETRWVFIPFVPTPQIAITASTGAIAFLEKAKEQIGVVQTYDHSNGYYSNGGFPPEDTGVCSDVIWRVYREMGIDFRRGFQADVEKNPLLYSGDLDPNINYRRVKRLQVYFSRMAEILTNEMIPGDEKNLSLWQPGDIVIFDALPSWLWHIGIIADTRDGDGVPYMLDNHGAGVSITITPLRWPSRIIGHYRVF